MIDIQKKYNEEKLRSEKAILQVNYEKQKSRTLQTSFIIVVLLFLGTYIYIYSYFKKKKLQQRMLQQKNELLLLNQKIQQWNQQVKLNQKKIHQLEQEKKQIEADLRIVSKEKSLYRMKRMKNWHFTGNKKMKYPSRKVNMRNFVLSNSSGYF